LKPSEFVSLLPGLPAGAEILVVRQRSLGDIVLETPAIAALHDWRSDLRIYMLVEAQFAAVLEGNPAISGLIFSRGLVETALALRRRRFAAVFNQHGGPRSAVLTAASGSRLRVGWKGFQFSFFYNVPVPDANEFYGIPTVHTVEHRISQFYWSGLPRGPIPGARVFPQDDAIESVASAMADRGILRGCLYAVLQPGARSETMRWPAAKYADIARWLRETHGIFSVVNLGERDEEVGREVRTEMRDCTVIPEHLNLRELIALIAGACLFVGNDSGPAHVAAAEGKSSDVIYGSTNPAQWRPWRSEHRIVQTGATFRAIRGDKSVITGETRPIQSISVDEVREACEELLATRPMGPEIRDRLSALSTDDPSKANSKRI